MSQYEGRQKLISEERICVSYQQLSRRLMATIISNCVWRGASTQKSNFFRDI